MSKTLLIIAHTPSPNTAALAKAGLDACLGYDGYDQGAVKIRCVSPFDVTSPDLLAADAVIIGTKNDVKINALAPTAGTRMTEGLIPEKAFDLMTPETVTPAVLYLVSKDAPTRTILAAGAGGYAVAKIVETDGIYLDDADQTPEAIAENWDAIANSEPKQLQAGFEQTFKFLGKAAQAKGISLE